MKLCTSRTKGFKSLVSVGGEVAYKGLVKGNFVFFFHCLFNCLVLISFAINSRVIYIIFIFYVGF